MILKKNILTTVFILIGFVGAFATPQALDRLIYNGDTLFVYLPLPNAFFKADTEPIGQFESIFKVDLFDGKKPVGQPLVAENIKHHGKLLIINCI